MFRKLDKPDECFTTEYGRVLTPIVTLMSDWESKIHIVLDSHSYIVYVTGDKGYKPTPFLRAEVLDVLRTLPNPK